MISTFQSPSHFNPYVASVSDLFNEDQIALEWMVIGHTDTLMLRRVSEVIDNPSSAMLQVPQGDWDFADGDLPEAVRWSLQEAELQNLVLVGHSKAELLDQVASRCGQSAAADSQASAECGSVNRLFAGAQRVQQETERAKRDFQDHVMQLLEVAEVKSAVLAGTLKVHALFYIAQSGCFLTFDPVEQTFSPIIA